MEWIDRGCEFWNIVPDSPSGRIARDPEYAHETVGLFQSSRRGSGEYDRDRAAVISRLEKLPSTATRRTSLIDRCLCSLEEKNCFDNRAVERVFQSPVTAYNRINSCNWRQTNGRQLAMMLAHP